MNQQFVSVTEARANLKKLMDLVMAGKSRVVLVRDSKPQAMIVPYADFAIQEKTTEEQWKKRWDRLFSEGKKLGKAWAKKKGIDLKKTSEEELYELIDAI